MNSIQVKFDNNQGNSLSARLLLPPAGTPSMYAIFAHCFTCSKDIHAAVNISRALVQHNIGVLRFDFTGIGESGGDFKDTSFSTNLDDLKAAAGFLETEYSAPSILIGHSLGGAAVLMMAETLKSVHAVVTIGAPADPDHVLNLLDESLEQIKEKGQAMVNIGGRPFPITREFVQDLQDYSPSQIISNLRVPLLILHSPQDKIVEIENARMIYEAAMHPKSFISMDGADHLLSDKEDSQYAGNVIAAWSARYVRTSPGESKTEAEQDVITRTGKTGYTTEVSAGRHNLLADEPESVGGTDLGPTPYDYLIAGLGACTGMTLRMYADRKKWPLEQVIVHLRHDKIHEEDCAHCDEKESRIDQMAREIEIIGDLSEEQIDRLLEIANKCPVHKTLTGEIRVKTSLRS